MAQLLAVWPQVQRALKAGHTLRLIHERMNMAGLPISYKRLIVYRGRIERRKKRGPAPSASPNTPLTARPPDKTPPAFDPLANFHAQEEKKGRPGSIPQALPMKASSSEAPPCVNLIRSGLVDFMKVLVPARIECAVTVDSVS